MVVASGSGGSRTHSIPGSKPRWSASCLPSRLIVCLQYPEQDSNLQTSGFKPDRSANWRTWAKRIPMQALNLQPPGLPDLLIRRHPEARAALPPAYSGCFSSPGGTRTPDPLLVRELPSPLGYRTMLFQWTHRESHPDLRHATPASSCWTMSPFGERRFTRKHAPKDLNPDQLVWNQSCCHYTRGV